MLRQLVGHAGLGRHIAGVDQGEGEHGRPTRLDQLQIGCFAQAEARQRRFDDETVAARHEARGT